ncbi:MAG: DUF2147 domain-containing protein [Pseudolabrys sp.]
MKCVTAAAFGLILLSSAAYAGAPEGTWLSQDGGSKVRLSDCGGKLCGTVVWLNEPVDRATGKPKTDKHNPDPGKRARPLIGLQVASLAASGPNHWSGRIYNADDGRTYQASFKVQSEHTAWVEGCVLAVLCKSHIWTRAK